MRTIELKDINLGGLADSLLVGQANSVADMVGLDIHSEPGIIKVNQKLTKASGILIDDIIKCIVPCSDGKTYFFGATNGKIWERSAAGVYAYVATVAPAAGGVGIFDAREYQGYIYYAMQSRLGRVAVGAPTDWTTRSDSWSTFTNTDVEFHPMTEQNQVLYIGDKHYVAQVDAGVFSANALDLAVPLRIKALGKIATDLLVGIFTDAYRVSTQIFRWITWQDSFSGSDEVPEMGINAFIATDNYVLVNAGRKGNMYLYNGAALERFKRVPGVWSGTAQAMVHPNATANLYGIPLFGLSNVSGNPAKQGIYSLGGYDRNYPAVLNLEWLISTGGYSGIDIGVVELIGDELIVSWKQGTTVTMTIADPGVVTYTAHGLTDGEAIVFTTTGALPTGITAGTVYYARSATADTLHIYDTSAHAVAGGSTGRVITTGSQSGVHTASIFGIDKLDTTAKMTTAYFTCRLINVDRISKKVIAGYVAYRSLPSGSSIAIYYQVNHSGTWTAATTVVDTDRNIVYTNADIPEGTTVQIKVVLTPNGNNAPEIESAFFSFE